MNRHPTSKQQEPHAVVVKREVHPVVRLSRKFLDQLRHRARLLVHEFDLDRRQDLERGPRYVLELSSIRTHSLHTCTNGALTLERGDLLRAEHVPGGRLQLWR